MPCWLDRHNRRTVWVGAAVARLEELVPYGGHKNKEVWTTYLPHAIYVAGTHGIVNEAASAGLLDRVGRCQASLGQYSAAETTHRQALLVRAQVLEPEHPDTLTSMNNVALALSGQGKYAKAEKMHRKTLELRKDMLGEKHPSTLTSMYCLAHVLAKQLRYDDSGNLYEQACAAYDTVLGKEHPTTRACHQHHRQMLALQEQGQTLFRPEGNEDVRTSKRRRLT